MVNLISAGQTSYSGTFAVGNFSIEVAMQTQKGRRPVNQDSFGISYEHGRLRLVVADGASSRPNAEYASAIAVKEYCSVMGDLRQQAHNANAAIIQGKDSLQLLEIPVTTVAVLDLEGKLTKGFSLGDSRIYCHQRDLYSLKQLTLDHMYGPYKERLEGVPATERENRCITLYLGNQKFDDTLTLFETVMGIRTDWTLDLRPSQTYLLCTDGLFQRIPILNIEPWLKIVLAERQPLTNIVQKLIKEALDEGTRDDITIALARVKTKNTMNYRGGHNS
jgi:serine/threonine protein phosphatase PrpC